MADTPIRTAILRHPKAWPWDPRVCLPQRGLAHRDSWMARPSLAMTVERVSPSRLSLRPRRLCRALAFGLLPAARFLQRLGDLRRHVGLVVLGQHLACDELAAVVERAFDDHALAFAEQVRQQAAIGHLHIVAE